MDMIHVSCFSRELCCVISRCTHVPWVRQATSSRGDIDMTEDREHGIIEIGKQGKRAEDRWASKWPGLCNFQAERKVEGYLSSILAFASPKALCDKT